MYIYKIENKINGKAYIGQTTKNPEIRWKEHKCSAKSGDMRRIYQAIRKYGIDNFEFSVLCETRAIEFLDDLEIQIIEQEHSFSHGYNMTCGGKALASRGRPNTWFQKAVDTRRRNGNTYKVRTVNFEIQDMDGNIFTGKNLTEYCRNNYLSVSNMWETFYGRRKHHKGYKLIRTFND